MPGAFGKLCSEGGPDRGQQGCDYDSGNTDPFILSPSAQSGTFSLRGLEPEQSAPRMLRDTGRVTTALTAIQGHAQMLR